MTGRLQTLSGHAVFVCDAEGPLLDGPNAAADLLGELFGSGARIAAVPTSRLGPTFLQLSSGVLGEVAQKFVNYGMRLAVVGDITAAVEGSNAFRDFVREANKARHVTFAADLDALALRLADEAR